MQKLPIAYIYNFISKTCALDYIYNNRDRHFRDIQTSITNAEIALEEFINNEKMSEHFELSKQHGENLLAALRKCSNLKFDDVVKKDQIAEIRDAHSRYSIVLQAELGNFPSFFASNKSSYDIRTLLERGDLLFPRDVLIKVPEAVDDLRDAGRALAFAMFTACGYHIFRATESVLRIYYTNVTNGNPHPKNRSISVYVTAMRKNNAGDERVIRAILEFATFHRNPIIHPGVNLDEDEVISIMGMSRSIVSMMLKAIPLNKPYVPIM